MKIRTLMAAAAISAIATAASAQGVTQNVPTKVKFVEPLTVTSVASDLNFGTLARGTNGTATVTIAANDGTRAIASANGVSLAGGTISRARYTVDGTDGETISISLTPPDLGTGLTVTPTINGLTLAGTTTLTTTAVLPAASALALDIGGTLEIAANANPTAGQVISANMALVVNYQ